MHRGALKMENARFKMLNNRHPLASETANGKDYTATLWGDLHLRFRSEEGNLVDFTFPRVRIQSSWPVNRVLLNPERLKADNKPYPGGYRRIMVDTDQRTLRLYGPPDAAGLQRVNNLRYKDPRVSLLTPEATLDARGAVLATCTPAPSVRFKPAVGVRVYSATQGAFSGAPQSGP